MRFSVELWSPDYGAGIEEVVAGGEPTAVVDCSIEVPEREWAPIRPDATAPRHVSFVDGVSRIDAQVWIGNGDAEFKPGLCATYAAGIVHCDGRASIGSVEVRRGLFTASPAAAEIRTGHAAYEVRMAAGDADQLALAVVQRMRDLEADVARGAGSADLVVLDGLLWGRTEVPHAIGYVKSHRAPYLPAGPNGVVAALAPGERTPLFLVATAWNRYSWYLRLPGASGHPWSGVVRCEASPDLQLADACALADAATAALPKFASSGHKDPRAPQNLYPIGGLERELRRRSGDPHLLYRSLRQAAASR